MPAFTVGGNLGDLPESSTRHSRMPVDRPSAESNSSRSLVVVPPSNVIVLCRSRSAPSPSAPVTGTNPPSFQYISRDAAGRPTPCPSAHQYASILFVLIGWLHP